MTPEAVDDSFRRVIDFVKTYYHEYDHKVFHCHSRLMVSQPGKIMGSDSNIAKFQKRFHRISSMSDGRGVFYHVFLKNNIKDVDIKKLPETTALYRNLKNHYLADRYIYIRNRGHIFYR